MYMHTFSHSVNYEVDVLFTVILEPRIMVLVINKLLLLNILTFNYMEPFKRKKKSLEGGKNHYYIETPQCESNLSFSV